MMKEPQPSSHGLSPHSTLRGNSGETLSAPLWIVDGALAGAVFGYYLWDVNADEPGAGAGS